MIRRVKLWFRKLAIAVVVDYDACVDPNCDCEYNTWSPEEEAEYQDLIRQKPEPEYRPQIGRTMCADKACRCNGSDY